MAAQVKKNKNQFIRKGTASSTVINTRKDVNIVDVSAIQSGLERVQIDTSDVNSGVQSGEERVPINTTNANSVEIIGDLRSIQKYAEEVNLFPLSEQPATNSCTDVGGASGMPKENFDPGGTMHAPVVYSQSSEYMPKSRLELHSLPTVYNQSFEYMPKLRLESHSKTSIGIKPERAIRNYASCNFGENLSAENPRTTEDLLFAQGAVQRSRYSEPHGHTDGQHTDTYVSQLIHQQMLYQGNSPTAAGQQTSDHMDYNHEPPLPKTPPPELLAKPPRIAKNKTSGQDSSPTENRRVNQRSPVLKKNHSYREQKEASHQYSNNLDDDGEEDKDISWEYPGERNLLGHQMMASDIQYPIFREHSQMHYGGEGIGDDIGKGDKSSEASQMFGWQYREQTGRMPGRHPGRPMQQMQGVSYKGNMGNMHSSGSDSGYTPSWQEEYSGQWQDGHHSKGPSMHSMEYFGQFPTWHHAGTMGPVTNRHHAGTMGPVTNRHHAGTMGPVPNIDHTGTMGPVTNIHHTETMGPVPNIDHTGTMGPISNRHHAGTMGPVPNIHHTGTIGQMPYQLNEGSMQQMHGGSMEQMHPHAQSEVMNPSGQQYMGEFHPDDIGQSWDFSMETRQGDGQGNASYSQGASNFPGTSSYMTDRELASEHLDQRMNNPWFREMVQNMKELVEREGLIVKDVFPDGNCLFTAVVDQLRVRGNFSFTPSTLRAAAVAFLRENPKQHDGTHLEQFLLNESWDHYLGRICKDGEWGEHIILGAMSEVLKCRIIVLGGMSGNLRTVVQPQHMSDEEEKKLQKEKEEASGSKTVKDGSMTETANSSKTVKDKSLTETAKSEVTGVESQQVQTGAASSTSKVDVKTKGTDTNHSKDKTGSLSKQDKEKKDKELQIGEDLYIGLLGEMHYVSLRKKDWEERLNEKLKARIKKRKAKQRQEAGQENDSTSDDDLCLPEDELGVILNDDFSVDHMSGVPVLHLNFLCRQIKKLLLRPDLMPPFGWAIPYTDKDFPDWLYEIFGKEEVMLERVPVPTLSTNYTDLFCSNKDSDPWKWNLRCFVYMLTKDTLLVESEVDNSEIDLIMDRTNCMLSVLRLRPVNPSLWGKFICTNVSGVSFLMHVRIDTERLEKKEWVGKEPSDLSFRCPWPREAAEYIHRYRGHSWPQKATLKRITSEGCRVVPRKAQGDDTLWTFSFDAANKVLISQGLSIHQKNCYKLWTLILRGYIKDVRHEHCQLFRAILFHACEKVNAEIWENSPAVAVLYMTDMLIIDLQRKYVPDYFLHEVNLVSLLTQHDIRSWTEKLQMMRYHFFDCVYFVIEKFALSAGKLLHTYDDVAKDVNNFFQDKDFQRSFSHLILPAVWKEVKTFVKNRSYGKAEERILRFYEAALRLKPCLNFSCFFQQCLPELDIAMQWCLAFYVDKRQGTSFTKDLSMNHKTVPITDLLGPELVRILGLLNVPEMCTKGKVSVYFVDRVTDMFSELNLEEAVIASLSFFLRKNYLPERGVYVFDEDCSAGNNGGKSKDGLKRETAAKSIKRVLYDMLVTLYDKLSRKEKEIEFRDFMLQFENVCDRLNTESAYKYLQELWELFGCLDKAERAKFKYLSLKNEGTDINGVD